MFMAIARGMPTGLAALLHQAQVFFTVLMAAWWLGEPVRRHQTRWAWGWRRWGWG